MKVMILYTNYGMGHQRAALALEKAIKNFNNTTIIDNFDIINFSRPTINFIFRKIGKIMATKLGKLRLKIYNKKMYGQYTGKSVFSNFYIKLFWTKKLEKRINDFQPNLII